jgi:hypothetical protein
VCDGDGEYRYSEAAARAEPSNRVCASVRVSSSARRQGIESATPCESCRPPALLPLRCRPFATVAWSTWARHLCGGAQPCLGRFRLRYGDRLAASHRGYAHPRTPLIIIGPPAPAHWHDSGGRGAADPRPSNPQPACYPCTESDASRGRPPARL